MLFAKLNPSVDDVVVYAYDPQFSQSFQVLPHVGNLGNNGEEGED